MVDSGVCGLVITGYVASRLLSLHLLGAGLRGCVIQRVIFTKGLRGGGVGHVLGSGGGCTFSYQVQVVYGRSAKCMVVVVHSPLSSDG